MIVGEEEFRGFLLPVVRIWEGWDYSIQNERFTWLYFQSHL